LAGQAADETLTPAEISVLRFMAQGHTYPEIASALALSEEAVEAQVRNIQSKLDTLDRTLAAMPELERGMVRDRARSPARRRGGQPREGKR
jgi:DNA-binding NarL/FixJ family response regulator